MVFLGAIFSYYFKNYKSNEGNEKKEFHELLKTFIFWEKNKKHSYISIDLYIERYIYQSNSIDQ